jgi:protein-disulfide isomerase
MSAARKALRRARLRRLAIVAAIVATGLAILMVTASGGDSPPRLGSRRAITTVHAVTALLAGIRQRADVLGQPKATITLEWYGDLQCPYCREFTLGALPSIIRRWVRGGELRIEYLSMETATHGPNVFRTQQVAALAAGLQDKMWNFVETFYHEQGEEGSGYVTERFLHGLASQVPGLNVTLWSEDRFDPELSTQVETERQAAKRAHFTGTPAFLIGRTGSAMYGLHPKLLTRPTSFDEAIEYLLSAE